MPSVIIVDDEPTARQGLRRMLEPHEDIHIVGEEEDVPSALRLIRESPPDAVFLDIALPPYNGFELLKSLPAATQVIFVTAHAEHAPMAFEVAALDYLLKPVRPQRLAQSLDRLRRACHDLNLYKGSPPPVPPAFGTRDHLCLQSGGRTLVVPVGRIAALRADGDFTRFYVEGAPPVLMSYNLGKYESQLPTPPFARVGRSLMVNLTRVQAIVSVSRDECSLSLSGVAETFKLRRAAAGRLKRLIST
jgi:two-component system LytT family response regulator